jgi:hypothetical protein
MQENNPTPDQALNAQEADHADKAADLMAGATPGNVDNDDIHPKIGADYNAYVMQAR